jgi:ubiquinone/menaquinone biosynthesis C-methylase UbiE
MKWFRQSGDQDPLSVSMAGVRLADRVLVVGCGDPQFIAAVARKAGLTGRACAVDQDEALTVRTAAIVEREGALVETAVAPGFALPYEEGAFDVVIMRDVLPALPPDRRGSAVNDARRVLRPGGRCLVIDTVARGGLAGLLGRGAVDKAYIAEGGAARALETARFRAVRTLAEREGLAFVEGVKENLR